MLEAVGLKDKSVQIAAVGSIDEITPEQIEHRRKARLEIHPDFLVYLAGPITGLEFEEVNDWREKVTYTLPGHIHGISPLRNKNYLKGTGPLRDAYNQDQVGSMLSTGRGIFERDFYDVNRCDAVLANFLGSKKVSIGTVMELAWAKQLQKPVVLVIEDEGNIHEHSMLMECASFRVNNLQQGVEILSALLTTGA